MTVAFPIALMALDIGAERRERNGDGVHSVLGFRSERAFCRPRERLGAGQIVEPPSTDTTAPVM